MSPLTLAQEFAGAIADGTSARLPRLTRAATPEFGQACLLAFYRLRDQVDEIRAEETASSDLRHRIALASVLMEIDAAIADARTWLARAARRGGVR